MARQGSWDRKIWEDLGAISTSVDNLASSSGSVDLLNSSTTPLSASGVFTGSWVDVSGKSDVIVSVSTDQDGTYLIQFSPDGVNVDSTLTRYYRTAQINVPHRFTVTRSYFRVVFTNTSESPQTYLRLQSLNGSYTSLNAPTDSTLAQDFDAVVVRPTDENNEIVLGLRQGSKAFLKFGYNDNISTGTEQVVGSFGGTFTPLTTATTLTLSSSSASDASPSGVGARSLFIEGIDSLRRYQFEFVSLNGTSSVVTTKTWLGVNRIVVFSSGTTQTNVGTISCTATTGGTNQARIPIGTGVTQQLIFHTQDGHQGLIKYVTFNVLKLSNGNSPRVSIYLNVWNPKITNSKYIIRRYKLDTAVSNNIERDYKIPIKLDPTDVVWVNADTTQNSTIIDGELHLFEYRQVAT